MKIYCYKKENYYFFFRRERVELSSGDYSLSQEKQRIQEEKRTKKD